MDQLLQQPAGYFFFGQLLEEDPPGPGQNRDLLAALLQGGRQLTDMDLRSSEFVGPGDNKSNPDSSSSLPGSF